MTSCGSYLRRVAGLIRDNSQFRRLLAAQALTYLNIEIWYVAMPFVLLKMTQSPFWMGAVAAAGYLPNLLTSAAAGWWVDRWGARRVIVTSAAARAMTCLAIAFAGHSGALTLPMLAAGCFLLGAFSVAHATAKRTWIPSLVPHRRATLANCIDEGTFGLAEMFGTLGAGLAIARLGPYAALVVQAGLLAGSVWAVLRIPAPAAAPAAARPEFSGGFDYLFLPRRASRILLSTLAIGSVAHACCMVFFSMQVFFYGKGLGLDSDTIGWMIFWVSAMGASVSFVTERIVERLRLGNAFLLFAALVPAGLFIASGATHPAAVALAAGLILSGGKALRVLRTSLCQSLVPKPLLGRVNGVYHMLVEGMTPAVALAGGALAKHLGFSATFACAGVIGIACCAWFLSSPLRGLRSAQLDDPADVPALQPADAASA